MAFKMKGFPTQETALYKKDKLTHAEKIGVKKGVGKGKHPKVESPPEHKDVAVTKSTLREKIVDLEDRIQFLGEDLTNKAISKKEHDRKVNEFKDKIKDYREVLKELTNK